MTKYHIILYGSTLGYVLSYSIRLCHCISCHSINSYYDSSWIFMCVRNYFTKPYYIIVYVFRCCDIVSCCSLVLQFISWCITTDVYLALGSIRHHVSSWFLMISLIRWYYIISNDICDVRLAFMSYALTYLYIYMHMYILVNFPVHVYKNLPSVSLILLPWWGATQVDLQHGGATVFHHEVQCWRNFRTSNWENVGGCLRK